MSSLGNGNPSGLDDTLKFFSDPRNQGGMPWGRKDNPDDSTKGDSHTEIKDTVDVLPEPPPPPVPTFSDTGTPDRVFDRTTGDTAKRRALEEQARRRGRASTILTGGPGGEHLGI